MAKRASRQADPPREPAPAVTLLPQILGQPGAIATLTAAMDAQRIHHAWIFHGPAGVGKATTARAFAATLLDPTSSPSPDGIYEPDRASPVHQLVRAGSHPDLHVVTKELASFSRDRDTRSRKQSVIPVDVVREFLIEPAGRTGHGSTGSDAQPTMASKVLIVDEAHLLNLAGQNAVLKTLEEPAPGTIIILVTSNEDRLLPTVRSRCQRVAFRPLDDGAMEAWLARAQIDRPLPAWLDAYAEGSPGTVLGAIQADLASWHHALEPMLRAAARGVHDASMATAIASLVDAWASAFVASNPNASKDAANKAGASQMLRFLAAHARAQLRGAIERSDEPERWLAWLDAIALAEQRLASNVRLVFAIEELAATWVEAARSEPV